MGSVYSHDWVKHVADLEAGGQTVGRRVPAVQRKRCRTRRETFNLPILRHALIHTNPHNSCLLQDQEAIEGGRGSSSYLFPARPWRAPASSCRCRYWAGSTSRPGSRSPQSAALRFGPGTRGWTGSARLAPTPASSCPCRRGQWSGFVVVTQTHQRNHTHRSWGRTSESRMWGMGR